MHVVVNSCAAYCEIAAPLLIESLRAQRVPDDRVHVVVGDCPGSPRDEIRRGVMHHFRPFCNLDNNGLIWLAVEDGLFGREGWLVYLHDTSLVTDGFWQHAEEIAANAEAAGAVCVRLHGPFSMGMGLYKLSWLRSGAVRELLAGLRNLDADRKQAIKNDLRTLEDTLFQHADREGPGRCLTLANEYRVLRTDVRMYGTDVPRIVEFYALPGVLKIKANHTPARPLLTLL